MRRRLWIFWSILAALMLYTDFQGRLLFPGASATTIALLTAAFFAVLIGWQFWYRAHPGFIDSPWFESLAWIGAVSMGVWAGFVLLSIPLNLAGMLGRWAGWLRPGSLRSGLVAAAAASALIAALGFWQVLLGPAIREVSIPLPGLPRDLTGLRIAQISDLHIGPMIREGYIRRVVNAVLASKPDLIAITGDLVDGTGEKLRRPVEILRELKAPLGVYFVTGNHDYYWGAEPWLKRVSELGFIPLVDENRLIRRGESTILIGGVADIQASHFLPEHRSDPRRAAACAEKPDLKILLAHRPESCLEAEPAGFDLQLSGHTHGGQFFPFNLVVRLVHRYHRGLYRHGRLWLHVNPGTGFWGPPHRFWVPAEITLLRLAAR